MVLAGVSFKYGYLLVGQLKDCHVQVRLMDDKWELCIVCTLGSMFHGEIVVVHVYDMASGIHETF
jgi:hypothetical protein